MGDQLRRAAGSVLKGVAYPASGGGTMWSFDAYRWGETAPRDVTVRFAGEGGAVSALGRRGGERHVRVGRGHAVGAERGGRLCGGGYVSPGRHRARRVEWKAIAWSFLIFWEFE